MKLAFLVLLGVMYGSAAENQSAAAFSAILPVLHHPRCMNCHSRGDVPRQGDEGHLHSMGVRRGPDGDGVSPIRCSTCHQEKNSAGAHAPPGAPDWEMPPAAMPMIWEGLDDRQLCELLKDPAQNGHKSLEEVVQHMSTPLVLWGWRPGEGREPVPQPFTEFLMHVRQWVAGGAACPAS
jgi:hypothetical protein